VDAPRTPGSVWLGWLPTCGHGPTALPPGGNRGDRSRAGCTSGFTGGSASRDAPGEDGSVASGESSLEFPVPRSEITRGAPKDAIPAIVDLEFGADWSELTVDGVGFQGATIEPRLEPDDRVIGVARDGEARAYPLCVLNRHEVVNDELGGPLLVTYCPLCGSAVTAVRRADGDRHLEAAGSRWRRSTGDAVSGPTRARDSPRPTRCPRGSGSPGLTSTPRPKCTDAERGGRIPTRTNRYHFPVPVTAALR